MKKQLGVFLVAALGAVVGALVVKFTDQDQHYYAAGYGQLSRPANSSGYNMVENPDFMVASSLVTPTVVHVNSFFESSGSAQGWPGYSMPGRSSGSGVIITEDGYIATNNHVVRNADKIEVTLWDKRTYEATLVGTDPSTDLAMLKIDEQSLQAIGYGNSDEVRVGEWVLAVGNPFNLTSTVTAGIVSAKGRNLNMLNEAFAIESFIQTDAAVNPGNSGGALVNTKGELIGINTAIASEGGSYEGYSFAVPVNIVKKVMTDLKEYGKVQRGLIGVQIQSINAHFAEEKGLKTLDGAYVVAATPGGAASDAGIRAGDVITSVDGKSVRSSAELQEVVGQHSPGDAVEVKILRGDEELTFNVTLKSKSGATSIATILNDNMGEDEGPATRLDIGVELQTLTTAEKTKFDIENGVKVKKVLPGKMQSVGMESGFVITQINRKKVYTPADVESALQAAEGTVLIEGLTPEGHRQFFAFDY